ncbi:DegT/DnrJ/EryC1/StrS family aminotransferase [Candidatus Pelagibacter ubique]|jgi:perosamine synthetase|nr:DegT/DnrJ/EryC1/StrS family aminotransferase [Candidatus Pelagibacter ubique]
MKNNYKDYPLLISKNKSVNLFYPHIPKNAKKAVSKVLSGRWLGQGPLVDRFENIFSKKFCSNLPVVAVGAGTDALHLAYILSGIKKNDEVICPVFTCTATNIPLLYIGAKIKFADIDPDTLNISVEHVEKLITKKTKAIVFVNYGGLICDLEKLNYLAKKHKILLIQDAAQSLGAKYKKKSITEYANFTIFSFQAIKHITSGDGGALCIKNKKLISKARRIRWFGIDREKKQGGTWENDITEVGYKYQLTDIGAALLIESMKEFNQIKKHRNEIYKTYLANIIQNNNIKCLIEKDKKKDPVMWLFTILTPYKDIIQKYLRNKNIETNQVHFRNDRYNIFKKFIKNNKFKNMDKLQNDYLVLPMHTNMSIDDAVNVSKNINYVLNNIKIK